MVNFTTRLIPIFVLIAAIIAISVFMFPEEFESILKGVSPLGLSILSEPVQSGSITCDTCKTDGSTHLKILSWFVLDCSISGCQPDGILRIWESQCKGLWNSEYQITGSSVIWNPDSSGTYYAKVFDGSDYCTKCDPNYCTLCTAIEVSDVTTTTTDETTTTQPKEPSKITKILPFIGITIGVSLIVFLAAKNMILV